MNTKASPEFVIPYSTTCNIYSQTFTKSMPSIS